MAATLAASLVAGCTSSTTGDTTTPPSATGQGSSQTATGTSSSTSPTSPAPQPSSTAPSTTSCATPGPQTVIALAGGLRKPAAGLSHAASVGLTAAQRTSTGGATMIVAAVITGAPGRPTGVWAFGATTLAVNRAAVTYSRWKTAGTAARRFPTALRALHCVAHPTAQMSTRAPNRCSTTSAPDVISWFKTPGQPASAQRISAYDQGNCKPIANREQLLRESPTGEGNCTIVASLAANPRYDFGAVPAARPRGVLATAGPAC